MSSVINKKLSVYTCFALAYITLVDIKINVLDTHLNYTQIRLLRAGNLMVSIYSYFAIKR